MECYVFAILPFGLLWSLVEKRRRGMVGIIPLIAALVPAAISGVRALMNRRNTNNAATTAQNEATRQEGFRQKAAFYDPRAVQQRASQRAGATMRLGRLAGHFGSVDRIPPALRNALQAQRQEQTFQFEPGSVARAPRAPGSIGTDLMDAASQFDVEALQRGRAQQRQQRMNRQGPLGSEYDDY